ncbi:hypothetical protein [Bradyrhizobium guangdongense]|nr:hypothetical protein [Bradyrhizobium guangdongense]
MEPQHQDEAREQDPHHTERPASPAAHADFNLPFASEGLEQVRDSHC